MFLFFNNISFANKELLFLLILVPLVITWYYFKYTNYFAEVISSSTTSLSNLPVSLKQRLKHSPTILRSLAFIFLIIAIARPQTSSSWKNVNTKGIDIVMSLDISSSMLAKDFKPNRLEAAKDVAIDFINERQNDRVGLVIFAGESFTQCPLTSDHSVLKNLFKGIKIGLVQDGTAIGNGLATAVSRLKDSKSKSKVVILITDGVNNQGSVAPITAADIAETFDIRVYTVGVGTKGKALSPTGIYPDGTYQYSLAPVTIDEESLQQIAQKTGGKYFRATDNTSLKDVYKEIDRLEKTIFEEKNFSNKTEKFHVFAFLGALFLLVEFLLRNTYFKRIP